MSALKQKGRIAFHTPAIMACLLSLVLFSYSDTERARQKRWVYIPSNLYVNENVDRIEQLLDRAQAAGFNGILFADYKSAFWWKLEAAERWRNNAARLREMTRARDMELAVSVFPFGYASSLLYHDVNLASGMPVIDAPLLAQKGDLVPVQTAEIPNGSFERHRNHRVEQCRFQDGPGESSFIDADVKRHGNVSLRFENIGAHNQAGNGRICFSIGVKPWQPYRLRAWMKTAGLNGGEIRLLVIGGGRTLQWEHLRRKEGDRTPYGSPTRNLTTDWIEQRVAFNSLDNTEVNVYAGVWGGKTGTIWWDDFRIEAAPTLNLLRRDSLPVTLRGEDGISYAEGQDYERVVDPDLGRRPWPGNFTTRHDPAPVRLLSESRIKEGQTVFFSGYHTAVIHKGQVNCSLSEPKVFELCTEQARMVRKALDPDVYFMGHDEIRVAGWEPAQQKRFKTTGELLAYNVRRCYEIAVEQGGGKPVFTWSDMFDPHHNAHKDYYLVNNTLAGSWEGLSPKVHVMKWGGGERGRPGLQFFADRGHRQMIAAYYDGSVRQNHDMWTKAARDIPNIIGVMYTTWQNDYSDLEEFAEVWWGGD